METRADKKSIFTQPVLLAIIAAVVTIATMVNAYLTLKLNQKTEVTTAKIDTLHNSVNGKMEKLMELTKTAAKAEGKLEQQHTQDSIDNN